MTSSLFNASTKPYDFFDFNDPLAKAFGVQFAAGVNTPATADHCPIMGLGADAAWGAALATE